MPEARPPPDDLYEFANALVLQLLKQKKVTLTLHQIEDATQDLYLAGLQVWREKEDEGLAKKRMVDRRKNLIRDHYNELKKEPEPEATFRPVRNEDRRWVGAMEMRADWRGTPVEETVVAEFLERMPERRRRIFELRFAGFRDEEIAEELHIGRRTVEREVAALKEDYYREFTDRGEGND